MARAQKALTEINHEAVATFQEVGLERTLADGLATCRRLPRPDRCYRNANSTQVSKLFLHTFLDPCRRCLHLQPKQWLKEPDLGLHRQIPLTFSTENAQIDLGDTKCTHYSSNPIWSNLKLRIIISGTLVKVQECILINLN